MESQRARDEKIRVMVADNTRIHTQLLADALKRDHALDVISADSDSRGLIAAAAAHKVDVLLISSNLDEEPLRAFEILKELRGSHPQIRPVMLLDSSKREVILQAFRAGARGIFSRHESVDSLCKCVRSVHEGQIWATSPQMSFAVEALASSPTVRAVDAKGLDVLSKRELEVVHCVAEGLTNREIAERLGLSQHTIKNYLFRVFDKVGVSGRVELLFMTLSQGSPAQSLVASLFAGPSNGNRHDEATIAICQKSAEQGLPTAQLALGTTLRRPPRQPEGSGERVHVVLDRERANHAGQKPPQPVDDHGATARSRTKSRRVDAKDAQDSAVLNRKSSQRIDRLISKDGFSAV